MTDCSNAGACRFINNMVKTLTLAAVLCADALAQTPPPIIRLIRAPGNGTLSSRPYVSAKAEVDVVGATAATGLPETWLIERHPNFASIEDLDTAMGLMPGAPSREPEAQDEILGPARTMIAYYRPDWGYRSDDAEHRLGRARYLHITIYRIRPGADAELEKLMRVRRERMESVNLDRPDLVYHVISGGPSGLYIVIAPVLSLKVLDDGVAKLPVYAEAIADAEAAAGKTAAEIEIARESLLFRIDPQISYVSDEFASGDPDFWHPKEK
jgi:hypothetical protein